LGANPDIDAMWKSLTLDQIQSWKALSNTEPRGIISASTNFSDGRMSGNGTLDHHIGVATTSPSGSSLEVSAGTWAVFESVGPFPETLQTLWGRIYSEWFPHSEFELRPGPEMLWNEGPDTSKPDFRSEIWIPVARR
jgi:AraC family transcriptional regulator